MPDAIYMHPDDIVDVAKKFDSIGQQIVESAHAAKSANSLSESDAGSHPSWRKGALRLQSNLNMIADKVAVHGEYTRTISHKIHDTVNCIVNYDDEAIEISDLSQAGL